VSVAAESTKAPQPVPYGGPALTSRGDVEPGQRTPQTTRVHGRGRAVVAVVLIASIIATGLTRQLAQTRRNIAIYGGREAAASSRTSLSGMNSFALALLLGGLRGPLVMILWTSSENQKNENQLEDFDTKVEWIRLLQPEFDTVHIFQIWNKAYNISVKMASLANKYTTILDALDYGQSVDRERPGDINILYAIGQVYFDKLAGSTEKTYYRERVRRETLPHKLAQRVPKGDPAWRRLEMDVMLDDRGYILPEYLQPKHARRVDPETGALGNDGSELQYLKQYQPFPYGLSPYALGYNYYKRAQVLQTVGKQKHIQLSSLVIDSRPALALRFWGEEEWERGRREELKAFGKPVPEERLDMETPTGDLPLDAKPADPSPLPAVIFDYERAVQLCTDARGEYERHLKTFTTNYYTYLSHLDHIDAVAGFVSADLAYLKAMPSVVAAVPIPTAVNQADYWKTKARDGYQTSITKFLRVMLKHYSDDDLVAKVYGQGYTKEKLDALSPAQIAALYDAMKQLIVSSGMIDTHSDDRQEYERYVERATMRLKQLGVTMPAATVPATQPNKR